MLCEISCGSFHFLQVLLKMLKSYKLSNFVWRYPRYPENTFLKLPTVKVPSFEKGYIIYHCVWYCIMIYYILVYAL